MKKEAEKILNSSPLTITEIERWLSFLGRQSMLACQKRALNYLVEVQEQTLSKTEEVNKWIRVVSDVLSLVQGQERSVKTAINEEARFHCEICNARFEPRPNKPQQRTCGSKKCVNASTNKRRNLKRRQEKSMAGMRHV